MNLIFKKCDPEKFTALWNQYIDEYNIDFQYSLKILEFHLSNSIALQKDESFVVEQNGKCVGICFLPIEKIKDILNISISGMYVVKPLAVIEKVEKRIFKEIDDISFEYTIDKVSFSFSQFTNSAYNTLLSYGFIDTATSTCGINLLNTKEKLWSNLRKSYKSLINALLKSEEFNIVYSDEQTNQMLHNKYTEFHKTHMIKAGKEPKSDIIYHKQFELLENNLASIIAVTYKDEVIVTNYFFHNSNAVSYSSSAYDTREEFSNLALVHYLLWEAFLYFKNRGYGVMNFGEPCGYNKVNGLDDYLDEKQIDISHFKRGMGAEMKTLYRGIKYLSGNEISKFL